MSYKTSINLDSAIFNDAKRRRALSSVVAKNAKEFKNSTKRKMIESNPTGRIYEKGRGRGFIRSHKASDSGERPSPDTLTLVNAITDTKTGEFSATVEVADRINPENGKSARVYAERLQAKMNRPIMSDEDRRIAEIKLNYEANQTISKLL